MVEVAAAAALPKQMVRKKRRRILGMHETAKWGSAGLQMMRLLVRVDDFQPHNRSLILKSTEHVPKMRKEQKGITAAVVVASI